MLGNMNNPLIAPRTLDLDAVCPTQHPVWKRSLLGASRHARLLDMRKFNCLSRRGVTSRVLPADLSLLIRESGMVYYWSIFLWEIRAGKSKVEGEWIKKRKELVGGLITWVEKNCSTLESNLGGAALNNFNSIFVHSRRVVLDRGPSSVMS